MIIFKVYSLNRIKTRYFITVFFLVMVMLLIIIPFFSSEDEVVFSELGNKVVLVIVSSEPSSILLESGDDKEQQILQGGSPLIYEIEGTGRVHMSMEPKDGLPIQKIFTFEKGELLIPEDESYWENIIVNEWPNQVYEIQISFTKTAKMEMDRRESLIKEERLDIDGDNDMENLQFSNQGDYYFMQVDSSPRVILKGNKDSDFQWEVSDINHDGIKEIMVVGSFGEVHKYIELFQLKEERLKRIFWEHGEDIEVFGDGRIQVGKRLFDTTDHYSTTIYQWGSKEYFVENRVISHWQGNPKWPESPYDTILAFFEGINLGLMDEAMGYLNKEKKNSAGLEEIIRSVHGNWRRISPPNYYFIGGFGKEDQLFVAFYYDTLVNAKYNRVEVYGVELEEELSEMGPWKIKSIKTVNK